MRLTEAWFKIKHAPDLPKDIFLAVVIISVGATGFFLGRLSLLEDERRSALSIEIPSIAETGGAGPTLPAGEMGGGGSPGLYVGSKNGSTYHLPWCSGATRIKEGNKIWFATKEEAESKGYSPAGNCKGI